MTGPLVVSDQWPECTSLETWTHDVMRLAGVENASETEKAIAFFEWLRLFNRMATGGMIQAYEGPYRHETSVLDLHKNLFVYGWGFCDTHSRIAEAAWQQYTGDRSSAERVITMHDNGGFHTMYRLRLDGNYSAFDARYGYYLLEKDEPGARILDWREVGDDANILRNKTFRHRSRPFFEFFGPEWERALAVKECYYPDEAAWVAAGRPVECVFGNGMYETGTRYHNMNFRLPRGTTIERRWDNSAKMFYVPVSERSRREEPFLPSGRFYRVTETMFDKNWPKYDPNYKKAAPYLADVPLDQGYNKDVAGGRTIGQAWGKITYTPDLSAEGFEGSLLSVSNLVTSETRPFLRPQDPTHEGSATLDFYSPYVLVEGELEGELAGRPGSVRIELRALEAKSRDDSMPDKWSEWQVLQEGPGKSSLPLGRARFNGTDVSIHGVYRFQLRLRFDADANAEPAGLSSLKLVVWFENGIMSIPQIFAGANSLRFKVADSDVVDGPIRVTYRYQTVDGERSAGAVIEPADFHDNAASFRLNAPGLTRCNAVEISYQ